LLIWNHGNPKLVAWLFAFIKQFPLARLLLNDNLLMEAISAVGNGRQAN